MHTRSGVPPRCAPASMAVAPVAVAQRIVPMTRGKPERINVPRRPAGRGDKSGGDSVLRGG